MRSYNPKFFPQTTTSSQQSNNRSFQKTPTTTTSASFQKNAFQVPRNVENNDLSAINSKSFSNLRTGLATETQSRNPKRSLVIDIEAEPQTYNIVANNRIQPNTTTNQVSMSSPKNFKNPSTFNLNGAAGIKPSKVTESSTISSSMSPKNSLLPFRGAPLPGSFPQTTTNITANRIGSLSGTGTFDTFLSQLSPKSLHLRSTSSKNNLLDAHKLPLSRNEQAVSKSTLGVRLDNSGIVSEEPKSSGYQTTYTKEYHDIDECNNENREISFDYESGIPFEYNKEISTILRSPPKKVLTPIPNHEPTKCSMKRNGIVKAYAANTNQGIVRNYNEDRVSIILNIMKPVSRMNEEWPKCSFFGVYDGHGGVSCADFLRDNLHQYVIKEPSFPWNPREAIARGFETAEREFLAYADGRPNGELDKSGSCAIVALIVGDVCYIANVGDSRAVMSGDGGSKVYHLSHDHKPSEESEQKRILEAGGKIYQTQAPAFRPVSDGNTIKNEIHYMLGPHRVFPGRLSVSRTFGDIEAKFPKYGGNPNAVIATPEIRSFKINETHDFIVLGCDGIFDKLSSLDAVKSTWESTIERAQDVHQQCGLGVEAIMRESLFRRTLDNITVVMISLKNFKHKLFPRDKPKKKDLPNKIPETHSAPNLLLNRSLLNGSILKQNTQAVQALKEKSNEQVTGYSSNYSGLNYGDDKYKRSNTLLRESSPNLMKPQAGKKPADKEKETAPSMMKDDPHFGKRSTPKSGTSLIGNDENRYSSAYLDYLHHGKIMKVKSMDYKNGDFIKSIMKGGK